MFSSYLRCLSVALFSMAASPGTLVAESQYDGMTESQMQEVKEQELAQVRREFNAVYDKMSATEQAEVRQAISDFSAQHGRGMTDQEEIDFKEPYIIQAALDAGFEGAQ